MRRSSVMALAAATAAAVVGSCADDTAGPRPPQVGSFAVVPNFGALQSGIVDLARGRFVLTRVPGGAVAKDTVIDIAPDQDSVDLQLTVRVLSEGEAFTLTIRLIDTAGDTVFRGGPIEITPSTSGAPIQVEVPFEYVGTGALAAAVHILTPDTATFTGEIVVVTAQALDAADAAIPNTPVGWESLDTAFVRIASRDAQYRGTAVGGSRRGSARIVATLVNGQRDTILVSNQPQPTTILAESGNNQSARADSVLAQPLVARVMAGDGQGVAGLWVRFAVTAGGGALSAESVLTAADGRGGVQYTMVRSFQPHTITASTDRLADAVATFTATLQVEAPAAIEIMAGDGQTAAAGSAVAVSPQVRVLDADGLPVPGATVTFEVTGGGGLVTGGTQITDVLGLAAAGAWTLGTAAGVNALRALVVSGTETFEVFFGANGVAGPASRLVRVSGDGQADTVVATLPLPLVVRAEDDNGNPVETATVDWAAAAGNLSAPSTVTDALGLTQVTWTLGSAAGLHGATATLNGTAASVGFGATAAAGAATRLAFTVEPTDAIAGLAVTPAVEITAFDQFGNVAAGFTGLVQVGLLDNPGDASLGGATSAAATSGLAVFPDLTVDLPAVGYTFLATATGLESDTSAVFDVLTAGQVSWINPVGGNWSVGANWSTGAPPGPTDTAVIALAGTYTVVVDQDVTVERLLVGGATGAQTLSHAANTLTVTGVAAFGANAVYALSGGTVGGGGFTIAGAMTWTGGTIGGTTILTNDGTLTLSGAAAKTVGATAALTNGGTIAHTGIGSLVLTVGAVVTNGPSALYEFQGDAAIDWVSGTTPEPFVNNQGTIRKSGGAGLSFIDQLQNLGGTIDVQTGELELRHFDGTTNASTGGVFTVAPGATLDLTPEQASYDDARYQGTYSGSGGGTVLLNDGVLDVGSGATFDFPSPMFQWQGGSIAGGLFTNLDGMTWTAGTVAGVATVLNGGSLTLTGAGAKTLAAGAVLTNTGTVTHAGTGSLVLSVGSVVNNQTGALYELQGDVAIDWVAGTTPEPFVTNQGTIRKSAGTGLSFIDQLQNQIGVLDVQSGELELRSFDGTNNVSTGGTLIVAPGATLDLTAEQAAHDDGTYQGTYTGSGGGTVLLDNGVLSVGTGATFDLPAPMLQWRGGSIAGGTTFTNLGTLRASDPGPKTVEADVMLVNSGTLAVEGGALVVDGAFAHAAGAVLQGGGTLDLSAATVSLFDGIVSPGTSPGLLTLLSPGALTLGAASSVNIELGGTTGAGVDFDQLRNTNPTLFLGGTLNVTLIDPYVPQDGESWPILTGVAGSFATVNLPPGMTADTFTVNDTLFLGPRAAGGPGINTWTAAGGLWSNDANWSLGRAPIPGDTVRLTQGVDYQVTLDVSPTIAVMTIGGTGDVISLDVSDQTLTITDMGPGPSLDVLPLGSIHVGNGTVSANRIANNGSFRSTGTASLVSVQVSSLSDWRVAGGSLTVTHPTSFDFQTSGLLRLENDAVLTFNGSGFLTYLSGTIEAGLGVSNVIALMNGAELGLQADLGYDSLALSLDNARIQGLQTTERLTIGPDGLLILNGATLAEVQARVINQGSLLATGGPSSFLNDSLYNEDGAVVAVDGTVAVTTLAANGIDNGGVIEMSGVNQTTIQVTGAGGLTNRATGTFATQPGATRILNGTLLNDGSVVVAAPTEITRPGAQHVNGAQGTIDIALGGLSFAQSGVGPSFTNQGMIQVGPGTTLAVTGGAFTNAAPGGALTGFGTVDVSGTAFTNAGSIAPGQSPGLLTLVAPAGLALGAGSAVRIELAGSAAAGADFDQLAVTGPPLTLGGALEVTLIDGYQPAGGEMWPILTGVTGSFASLTLPAGFNLDTSTVSDTLYLTLVGTAGPPIIFAGDSAGGLSSGVFRVNGDGTGRTRVTPEGPPAEGQVYPRWSPDRTRATYAANPGFGPNQLHIISAGGVPPDHLTSATDTSTWRPRYSPDGVHLAFECGDGGFPNNAQDVCVIADVTAPLGTMDGIGDDAVGGKVYVTDAVDPTLGGSGAFAWNPQNADQLAVVRDSSLGGPVGSQIWLINLDGSGATPLTTGVILDGAGAPVQVHSMDWSPDGSFIAFEGLSSSRSIYRIEVATGVVTQLTSLANDHRPVISPDNSEIIFGREIDIWDLRKVPASGGAVVTMTPLMNHTLDQAGWDWSPDGSEIVLTEDVTTSGVVISKILRTTTATSFISDVMPVGRRAGFEVQDRQPSWRP